MRTDLEPSAASAAWTRGKSWLAAGVILVAALAAYHNSFRVPLLLDDEPAIAQNATIRHLWRLGTVLSPPPHSGPSGRPLLNLSFALNYAISGTDVWSYHAVNLLIHVLNGLVLFGIVRRTLQRNESLAASATVAQRASVSSSSPALLAFAVALLWTVHPLQTEAVTYISERAETLMGLFYLLTIYCFIRSAEADGETKRWRAPLRSGARQRFVVWAMLSILACLCGMATKEVMATAPLVVFLYDSVFIAGNPRQAWRSRRIYYAGLAACWLGLAAFMFTSRHAIGFRQGVSPWEYALTECQAVVHYLELAIWPSPLVFDYGPVLVSSPWKVLPSIFLLLGLLAGTAIAFRRSHALGFLGICFFLILAPSSSVVPVALQPIAENRMYLPLAAVIAGFVLAADRVFGARARWLVSAVALGAIACTIHRNDDYRDAVSIWADTAAKRPHNPRAQADFGSALDHAGRREEAIRHLRQAVELTPTVGRIHNYLGKVLHETGQRDEAIREFAEAVRLDPASADARANLAAALAEAGRGQEAEARMKSALPLNSGDAAGHYKLGLVLFRGGQLAESAREFERALQLQPDDGEALTSLGVLQLQFGDVEKAQGNFEAALRIDPADAEAHSRLGNILAMAGRLPEAIAQWEATLRLRPDDAETQNNLATALAQSARIPEAIQHYREAIRLKPDYDQARANLAALEARQNSGVPGK